MRTIMLDKLDARFLFLPQFEMTIDGGCNDEVRAVLYYVERKKKKRRGDHKSLYSSREQNRRTV